MKDQVNRVLDAQESVNINLKLKRVKRDSFKIWCIENKVTQSGMIISFMDDCIELGKELKEKGEKQ